MHALRFPLAAGLGLLVALAVFTLLWMFVGRPIVVEPVSVAHDIRFTRQIVDTPIEPKRREKLVRPPGRPRPVSEQIGVRDETGPAARYEPANVAIDLRPGSVAADVGRYERNAIGQDRDVIPIVRIAPDYPPRELAHQTQGWVKVQFSIAPTGTVHDAFVVEADPKGVFDAAALNAIARWRYNPKVENGVAAERVGVQTIIRFQIQ